MAALYGLVDAAQDERLYGLIMKSRDHECLLGGKLDQGVVRAAPHIVRLTNDSPLAKAWDEDGRGRNWGIKCVAENPLAEVRRHFRQFLQAQLPDGRHVLFRFWDPRVWRVYLPTCNAEELGRWFQDVIEYRCEGADTGQAVTYRFRGGVLEVSASI